MAKEKLNITLDADIKEKLQLLAEAEHMTISAYITYLVMKQAEPKIMKGQQRFTI